MNTILGRISFRYARTISRNLTQMTRTQSLLKLTNALTTSVSSSKITVTEKPLIRYKSKKRQQDSDDEEEDLSYDSSLTKDSKVVKFNSTSLRTDLILKAGHGVARNKIEQLFYESKIRVNGKKIMKKSVSVHVGDEIDIIKSVSPKNSDHLYISRLEIINIAAKEESIIITARRYKSLLIENYENDPFKGSFDPDTA